MIVLFLLSILLTLVISQIYFNLKKNYELINKIPGPPALPLIGNLALFNVPMDEVYNVLREINKKYYPLTRIWFGPFPTVTIHHPDDLEVLLSSNTHIEKGPSYKIFRPWLKTGLLTSTGSKWHQRRRILTPAFHFKILQKYLEITNEKAIKFIKALRNENKETVQDLLPVCTNYTLNIICESAMGVPFDKVDENVQEYKRAVFTIGDILMYRAVRPYIQEWMLTPLIKLGRLQKQTLSILHAFTDKVLLDRKEYHERTDYKDLRDFSNSEANSDNLSIGSKRKKLVMLDLLLNAEKDGLIDREGIKEELDTFMFAGHDTTGMALVYSLMLLAEHEDIQEKVRNEVIGVLNKSKGELGISEIQEFHYLERCIKETLRLYPPVPALSRRLKEDLVIRGYLVPAGTEVVSHMIDLHRNPDYWPEPEKYDPDRFLPERALKRHPYSYIPFSAGPRNCIGQKFALMELKCLLARILYNFQLKTVTKRTDMKLTLNLVVRPTQPVYVKFVRIDNNN
ncbi:cytochrome P450 4C1-like [Phymastichus coffea]|uniref:cytochrome P450 4C1-like n=1 Tax=Phymastichus coffea TaxID=108790 RepID=UPI00273BC10C|nr:cytochrome P450 4C1-like [Phymastichus coffea]